MLMHVLTCLLHTITWNSLACHVVPVHTIACYLGMLMTVKTLPILDMSIRHGSAQQMLTAIAAFPHPG